MPEESKEKLKDAEDAYNKLATDEVKQKIAASKTTHIFTNGGKYGNAKAVKAKKTNVSVKKGKTFKIKASEVKAKKPLKNTGSSAMSPATLRWRK